MEEIPSEKPSESGSINCASSSGNSQDTPNSLVDKDEGLIIGVVNDLKEAGMAVELKEGMAIELKEEGVAIELKEEGAVTIELKDEGVSIELTVEGASTKMKEGVAIDLKEDRTAIELKEEGADSKEDAAAIGLKDEEARIKLEEETRLSQKRDYEQAIKLKGDGTKLFQRRDYEGAASIFDEAIKLLPKEHGDIAFLHCNIAACYMHMNPEDYERAVDECNAALEASPKYTNALLKRARCFEALDRLDLAFSDVEKVLSFEPNNITALELFESIKEEMEEKENILEDQVVSPVEHKTVFAKEKIKRKVSRKFRNSIVQEEVWLIHDDDIQENDEDDNEENCDEENHMKIDLSNEENDAKEMQSRHNHDEDKCSTEQNHVKHDENKEGENHENQQLQHTSWDMEEMHRKEMQNQNKHENPLKEIKVRSGQSQQETHTAQNQVGDVDKRQKHIEEVHTTSQSKQETHTDMYERFINGNQVKNSLEQHTSRGEDKQENQSAVKLPSHGRDEQKHTREKSTYANDGETKTAKFVLGDDIRIALVPENCSLLQLINIARCKYSPHLKAMLLKFQDIEGDLVTITSSEELRWVEDLKQGPARLYIKEVSPEREITRDIVMPSISTATLERKQSISECGSSRIAEEKNSSYADDWMMQFARLFKNHVGFDSDAYVDLRDLGTRLYYEAMEDTITSDEAQEIFHAAEAKFQEMAALALFNWGNIHMSRAKKRLCLSEDAPKESVLSQVKRAYELACAEYVKAGKKFEDTVDVKPDFYEGLIALGHQQFEQAKLSWRYADACKVDMGTEVLELFNRAEDNMEKGMEMWEGIEYLRLKGMSKSKKEKILLDKLGLDGHQKDLTSDEAFEQASNMRSQLNISWGTILYERSVVEFKLGLASWEESLTEAIEKFKTGGASLADISVMIKNHCANEKTQEGLSFKIDEIVQAWNEMYDAKKLKNGLDAVDMDTSVDANCKRLLTVRNCIFMNWTR
ncbi:HSP-interacting protein isoform X1 [Lolium perenne]|uniref:HSP-interacting protein isoform X1 n=1 Tax=Lolium perenne TaxID=4522 RepID=UPI0021F57B81|nr:HSP-interacting protein-like isoform X1 [Lolium perenne]